MIDFNNNFELIAFGVVAGLCLIMMLASIVMLFKLHKGRMTFIGVVTFALTWIVMIVSLALSTVALIHRIGIMEVDKFIKGLGESVTQLTDVIFNALMMEIAVYALTALSIAQLIIHPLTWTTKKEYATPVSQADGNGYITVDEAFEHFDEASKQNALDVESVEVDSAFQDAPTLEEEPVVEEPAVEEPVADESIVEEPVVEEPVANEPKVEEPVVEEPVADEPIVEEPVVEEPVADEPIVEEPVAEEPVADEPIVEEPVAEEPVADEPIVEEPAVEETPVANEPIVEEPVVEEPKVEEPKIEVKTIARPSRTGSRIVGRNSAKRTSRVSDSASAVFAEYLKEKTEEEKAQIEKSIDRVIVNSNGKK